MKLFRNRFVNLLKQFVIRRFKALFKLCHHLRHQHETCDYSVQRSSKLMRDIWKRYSMEMDHRLLLLQRANLSRFLEHMQKAIIVFSPRHFLDLNPEIRISIVFFILHQSIWNFDIWGLHKLWILRFSQNSNLLTQKFFHFSLRSLHSFTVILWTL